MNFHIEFEREDDGRWIAEVPEIPGVLTYGATAQEAMGKAEALALRSLAERIETGDNQPMNINIMLAAASANGHLVKPNESLLRCFEWAGKSNDKLAHTAHCQGLDGVMPCLPSTMVKKLVQKC